ncbi:hypothetical protein D7Y13_02165 [Corallococcus praedator]|uniref:Lipoprotein n=1 Tax=Corallococcus praedator TaxID=2316724 RepID=A0ABX9QQK2_9BACT|nr:MULTISPECIES: hypothetical protein [Corallococcus]RKH20672.1 hypothetical protein D7X74_03595 [Corallococcus sp. CA047B]RKH34832.1 hypothetical protein D7X75_06455 [Corallococcus sp. CA031C]RKI16765.1 hypothetical protein D7Y13_02165 [Corallococcus praedator]
MKHCLGMFAALLVTGLVACGGMESGEAQEEFGQQSSALSCSAACSSGTLTCQGASCSAVDGSHVQCDGVYQYCPTTPPPLICSRANACVFINGTACPSPGASRDCCLEGLPTGGCYCTFNGRWTCTVPPEDP